LALFEVSRVGRAESKRVALMIIAIIETDHHKARAAVEWVGLRFKLRIDFCSFSQSL
jgi:hypothetical protein